MTLSLHSSASASRPLAILPGATPVEGAKDVEARAAIEAAIEADESWASQVPSKLEVVRSPLFAVPALPDGRTQEDAPSLELDEGPTVEEPLTPAPEGICLDAPLWEVPELVVSGPVVPDELIDDPLPPDEQLVEEAMGAHRLLTMLAGVGVAGLVSGVVAALLLA